MRSESTVAYLSSFPPRACGIATFTRDLSDAVAASGRNIATRVAAINDEGARYSYPSQVRWTIDQCDPESWKAVAREISASRVSLVSIQHEFGIHGIFERNGAFVDYLKGFLENLDKPVVATLHTVLPHPKPDLREAIRALHDRSAAVITMVNMARLILEDEYGLDPAKLYTIPHGVPAVRWTAPARVKQSMQFENRPILSTFGLLSSGKGIQYVIRGLPEVVKAHPDLLYLIIGQTHPEVRRRDGEKYRNSLIELIKKLHLEQNVRFVNQYLTQQQLIRYLQATDLYITPYVDRYQITSGTLAYALGCGKAVISTPYLYASEALAEGRGLMAEFQNPRSFARCISMLLENPTLREHCEQSAYEYGKSMSWANVGARYADLFRSLDGTAAIPNKTGEVKDILPIKDGIAAKDGMAARGPEIVQPGVPAAGLSFAIGG
ncbi:MAG TPA: glycosyltransferase family 4 protein [Chloroflexota bacterium]|nr:glycosyltransferase family 4 protein [Chloroflexota bacterium]